MTAVSANKKAALDSPPSVATKGEPAADHGPALQPKHATLFRELNDLKRIRSAGRDGSIATRLFTAGWAALAAGVAPEQTMRGTVAAALAAVRLGDLDRVGLAQCGLSADACVSVLQRGFDEVSAAIDCKLATSLRAALAQAAWPVSDAPVFVRLLADQPRAGVTCPGRPRLVFEPPENHAEHSLMVAVYGVVAAPTYGADPTAVFLAAMSHHLHGAVVPDSGFTGELLLGDHLEAVIAYGREQAFAALPKPLTVVLRQALRPIASDQTPEAKAFHAADVIDRVLQIEQHLKASRTTMRDVIDDFGLVHDGPVKKFHDRVLNDVGLSQ